MKKFIALGLLSTLGFSATAAFAGPEHEDRIREEVLLGATRLLDYTGSRDAGGDFDRDVEDLVGRHCGYEGIKIRAANKAARVSRVKVVFGNGASQVLHQGSLILERGETSSFMNFENRLNGDNDRCIDKVVVVGETLSRGRDNSLSEQTQIRIIGIR